MADSDKANYALSAHTAALTDNAKAVRKLLSQLKEATLAENEDEITRIAAQLFWNHGNSGHNYAVKFQNYVLKLDKSIGGDSQKPSRRYRPRDVLENYT